MNTILNQVTARHPLSLLIGDIDRSFVGYVSSLRYDEAYVQTNDSFKHAVGGLAHNSSLVAAGFDPTRFNESPVIDQFSPSDTMSSPGGGDGGRNRDVDHLTRFWSES